MYKRSEVVVAEVMGLSRAHGGHDRWQGATFARVGSQPHHKNKNKKVSEPRGMLLYESRTVECPYPALVSWMLNIPNATRARYHPVGGASSIFWLAPAACNGRHPTKEPARISFRALIPCVVAQATAAAQAALSAGSRNAELRVIGEKEGKGKWRAAGCGTG